MSVSSPLPPTAAPADEAHFISGADARTILGGAGWYRLHKHAITGEIRTVCRPGGLIKFRKADVEELARRLALEPKVIADRRHRSRAGRA
jgi:hypothetical protein